MGIKRTGQELVYQYGGKPVLISLLTLSLITISILLAFLTSRISFLPDVRASFNLFLPIDSGSEGKPTGLINDDWHETKFLPDAALNKLNGWMQYHNDVKWYVVFPPKLTNGSFPDDEIAETIKRLLNDAPSRRLNEQRNNTTPPLGLSAKDKLALERLRNSSSAYDLLFKKGIFEPEQIRHISRNPNSQEESGLDDGDDEDEEPKSQTHKAFENKPEPNANDLMHSGRITVETVRQAYVNLKKNLPIAGLDINRVHSIDSLNSKYDLVTCDTVIYTVSHPSHMAENPHLSAQYRHTLEWDYLFPRQCYLMLFPVFPPSTMPEAKFLKYRAGTLVNGLYGTGTIQTSAPAVHPWIAYYPPETFFSNVNQSLSTMVGRLQATSQNIKKLPASYPKYLRNDISNEKKRRLSLFSAIATFFGFSIDGAGNNETAYLSTDVRESLTDDASDEIKKLPFRHEQDRDTLEWKMCSNESRPSLSCNAIANVPPLNRIGFILGSDPDCGESHTSQIESGPFLFRPSLMSSFFLESIYSIHQRQAERSVERGVDEFGALKYKPVSDALLLQSLLNTVTGFLPDDMSRMCETRKHDSASRRRWWEACNLGWRFLATRLVDPRRFSRSGINSDNLLFSLDPSEIDDQVESAKFNRHIYSHRRSFFAAVVHRDDLSVVVDQADYWFDQTSALGGISTWFENGLVAQADHAISGPAYIGIMCGKHLSGAACPENLKSYSIENEHIAWRCGDFAADFRSCGVKEGFFSAAFRRKSSRETCAKYLSLKTNYDRSPFSLEEFQQEAIHD